MLVEVYVAICKSGEEEFIAGVGINRRMVEIQHDSFMSQPDHIAWKSQIQTLRIEVVFVDVPEVGPVFKPILTDIDMKSKGGDNTHGGSLQKETQISNEGE